MLGTRLERVPTTMTKTFNRSWLILLLVLYAGVLLYGTLKPFRFTWHPGRDKMSKRSQIEWVPFTRLCPTYGIFCPQDTGLNIAIFMPLGALVALMSRPGPGRLSRTLRAVIVGCVVSVVIETAQYFIPDRFPGITDVIWNTLGACLGGLVTASIGTHSTASPKNQVNNS